MTLSTREKIFLSISLTFGCLFILISFKTGLLINRSESLPQQFYLLVKGSAWQKNDLVAISGFDTQYSRDQHFTKRILGVPGDRISIRQHHVCINAEVCVPFKSKTKDKRKLTTIEAQIIPKRHYFVLADHKDSFDSRYQEFGLVKDVYIEGKAYPLW
jgi:conjugal transfer pilin signal peptidase TrbI